MNATRRITSKNSDSDSECWFVPFISQPRYLHFSVGGAKSIFQAVIQREKKKKKKKKK